jgi:hypothetical protein
MRGVAAAAIVVAIPFRTVRDPGTDEARAASPAAVDALFANVDSVCRVGVAYRRQYGDARGVSTLHRRLFGRTVRLDQAELAGWMRLQRENDLAMDDVVIVSGWLLARSEARLCAAVAQAVALR